MRNAGLTSFWLPGNIYVRSFKEFLMIYKKANEGMGTRLKTFALRFSCTVAGRVLVFCPRCPPFPDSGFTSQLSLIIKIHIPLGSTCSPCGVVPSSLLTVQRFSDTFFSFFGFFVDWHILATGTLKSSGLESIASSVNVSEVGVYGGSWHSFLARFLLFQ